MNSTTLNASPTLATSMVAGTLDPKEAQPSTVGRSLPMLKTLAMQPVPLKRFTIDTTMTQNTLVYSETRTTPFDLVVHARQSTWRNVYLSQWMSGVFSQKITLKVCAPEEYKYKFVCYLWNYATSGTARDPKIRRNNAIPFISTEGRQHSVMTAPVANQFTYNNLQQDKAFIYWVDPDGNTYGSLDTVKWNKDTDKRLLYRMEVYLDMALQCPVSQAKTIDVLVFESMNFIGTHVNGGFHQVPILTTP